jgi:hypothetical protein
MPVARIGRVERARRGCRKRPGKLRSIIPSGAIGGADTSHQILTPEQGDREGELTSLPYLRKEVISPTLIDPPVRYSKDWSKP